MTESDGGYDQFYEDMALRDELDMVRRHELNRRMQQVMKQPIDDSLINGRWPNPDGEIDVDGFGSQPPTSTGPARGLFQHLGPPPIWRQPAQKTFPIPKPSVQKVIVRHGLQDTGLEQVALTDAQDVRIHSVLYRFSDGSLSVRFHADLDTYQWPLTLTVYGWEVP